MILYWNALLELLPPWMREALGEPTDIRELRMRLDQPPQVCTGAGVHELCRRQVRADDLSHLTAMASRCSAYAYSTMAEGYITARGGHRIGLCGTAVIKGDKCTGLKDLRSACIRIARDIPGAASGLYSKLNDGSVLILGPPGSGKTTLARDLIRDISAGWEQISVVDQRGELFPAGSDGFSFPVGPCTDVLTGITKADGIEMVLCSMGPRWIAVDEISREVDCRALVQAGYCGVRFLATCHAKNRDELLRRPVYRALMQAGLFQHIIIMQDNQTYTLEELQ